MDPALHLKFLREKNTLFVERVYNHQNQKYVANSSNNMFEVLARNATRSVLKCADSEIEASMRHLLLQEDIDDIHSILRGNYGFDRLSSDPKAVLRKIFANQNIRSLRESQVAENVVSEPFSYEEVSATELITLKHWLAEYMSKK